MPYTTPHDPHWDPLLEAAWHAWEQAYAPYSHFQVGAALLRGDGSIQVGCNVENASYGGTICAERTAICAAAAQGLRPGDLVALVVVTQAETLTPPCGLCRQVIAEFAEDLPILLANRHARALHSTSELLPHAFTGRNLLDSARTAEELP
jgi:cytidine deaminase